MKYNNAKFSNAPPTEYLLGGAKLFAAFALTLLALWLLLILSTLIPNQAIRSNMEQSALNYREREAFEFTREGRLNSVADNYADAIWLNVAWNVGVGDPLTASIRTSYYDGEELGENAGLYLTLTKGTAPNTDYSRYWHGTVIFIRLLHLFTDVDGAKQIGFAAMLVLILLTGGVLLRKRHGDLALLLLVALAAVRFWNLRLSMEYQPAFLVAFTLIPLYLLLERRGDRHLTVLSVISGTAVAFFDFLTTETVTILLPLALVIAVRAKEKRLGTFRENLPMLIKCGASWGIAYAGTFLIKWLLASLVTGGGAFVSALGAAAVRFGSVAPDLAERPDSFLSAPLANLNMLFGGASRVNYAQVLIGTAFILAVSLSLWYLLRSKEAQSHAPPLLLGLGAIVLLRYLVLNNHSYLHCFFTHRALVTLIFALLASLWLNISLPQKRKGGRR